MLFVPARRHESVAATWHLGADHQSWWQEARSAQRRMHPRRHPPKQRLTERQSDLLRPWLEVMMMVMMVVDGGRG